MHRLGNGSRRHIRCLSTIRHYSVVALRFLRRSDFELPNSANAHRLEKGFV